MFAGYTACWSVCLLAECACAAAAAAAAVLCLFWSHGTGSINAATKSL